jgi:hypothetical protein
MAPPIRIKPIVATVQADPGLNSWAKPFQLKIEMENKVNGESFAGIGSLWLKRALDS